MGMRMTGDVLRRLGTICKGGVASGLSDAELLDRFASRADRDVAEAAIEAIVHRHGPLVLGICRKVLGDPDDAEDAFQATFLVLARRAGSVRLGADDSLGRWLSGVARRVANRARRRSSKRGRGARPPGDDDARRAAEVASGGPGPVEALLARERAALLRAEIAGLPDHYREPVELCHLEGRSIDEAAEALGRPAGTIKARLSRARAILRDRLTHRGLSPDALPSVPAVLVHRTVRLVVVDTFPSAAAAPTLGAIGTGAALSLAEGTLSMMMWTKVYATGAVLIAAGASATAVGGLTIGEGRGDGSDEGFAVASAPGEPAAPGASILDASGEDEPSPDGIAPDPEGAGENRSVDRRIEEVKALIEMQEERLAVIEEERRQSQLDLVELKSRLITLEREAGAPEEAPDRPRPDSPPDSGEAPLPDDPLVSKTRTNPRDEGIFDQEALDPMMPQEEGKRPNEAEITFNVVRPRGSILRGTEFKPSITVWNRGEAPAQDLKLVAVLSDGQEVSGDERLPSEPRRFVQELGVLEPGKAWSPKGFSIRAMAEGVQTLTVWVEGSGIDTEASEAKVVTYEVVAPDLDLTIRGPERRPVGAVGHYELIVTNRGTAAASDVAAAMFSPDRVEPDVPGDAKHRRDPNKRLHSIYWRIPRLDKGETKQFRVPVRFGAIGKFEIEAAAHSDGFRDPKETRRTKWTTEVVGIADVKIRDVARKDTVIAEGETTEFEIRIENVGSKEADNVHVDFFANDWIRVEDADSPNAGTHPDNPNHHAFERIDRLAPGAERTFVVTVKGIKPGIGNFDVKVFWDGLPETVAVRSNNHVRITEAPEAGATEPDAQAEEPAGGVDDEAKPRR